MHDTHDTHAGCNGSVDPFRSWLCNVWDKALDQCICIEMFLTVRPKWVGLAPSVLVIRVKEQLHGCNDSLITRCSNVLPTRHVQNPSLAWNNGSWRPRAVRASYWRVVLSSRATSTVRTYSGTFLRWKRWAIQKCGEACFSAQPLHVVHYLTYLILKSPTNTPIVEAVNAIS